MATYSFLDTNASIVGPGGSVNLAAGAATAEEGITITPTTDINTMTVGADGAVMHSLHANKSGHLTVTLLKTSPVNQQLSLMYALQTASGANHGQNTMSLSNTLTGDAITAQIVAFKKAPEIKYAMDGGTNVWEFDAGIIDRTLGNGA